MNVEQTKKVLNQMVADLSQFSVMIHQAHWYMRGSEFLTLHPQMDEYMDEVDGFLDEVAERLITIGGAPYSTLKEFAEHTKLEDKPGSYDVSMNEHIETLINGYRYLQKLALEGIHAAGDEEDHVTEDLFIEIKGAVEKNIWMLTAKLNRAPEL
ncbi:DNA starvation/stationary phase protection protein [Vagococcus lutrae]|uniref:Dps family protein n=1 Tax=Vagococcus lutrae TaxID=81947 RepID=UPI00200DE8B7|nr:Dps family protein [Vagococcus lutrae]UQF71311.1 DNA starvation/stationary phase protection protein [Vagococcus lutrae]